MSQPERGAPLSAPVRALTVRQPWAALISRGLKRGELRSWAPPASLLDGGTLLIHAAKAAPVWGSHRRRRLILGRLGCDEAALPLGAVVATCKVESALAVERAPRRPGGPCRVRDLRTGAETSCETDQWGLLQWGSWARGQVVWRLVEVAPLATPVPCPGRQGLWRPSRETEQVVRSAPVDRRAAPIRPTRNAGRPAIGRQSAGNRQASGPQSAGNRQAIGR